MLNGVNPFIVFAGQGHQEPAHSPLEQARRELEERRERERLRGKLDPSDHTQTYLAETTLPEMPLGECAPPLMVDGHKTHLNKLFVKPSVHRQRLEKILDPLATVKFTKEALDCRYFPSSFLSINLAYHASPFQSARRVSSKMAKSAYPMIITPRESLHTSPCHPTYSTSTRFLSRLPTPSRNSPHGS